MTTDEAAQSLRDDPSFSFMPREEQEVEAATLLGSDDPLEIALAIEAALRPDPSAVAIATAVASGTSEPCRNATDENLVGCGGREPVAANGRCMTCGAHRGVVAETGAKALNLPTERDEPVSAPSAALEPRIAPSAAPGTILARFKAVTGSTDKELGAMLGVSRSAMHAYVTGFLPERVSTEQMRRLLEDIAGRAVVMAALERDLRAEIE